MGWNCTAGRDATIFTCGTPVVAFSTLICFEDVMPWLSRRAVRRGARLLINQTNDAWFDRTGGPAQHMAQCVFRAVENRVPVLRVANSGITCLIHPSGLIDDRTQNSRDEAPEALVRTWAVSVDNKGRSLSFYARHGDIFFAVPCAVLAVVCLVLAILAWRRNEPAPVPASAKAGEENL
jgi:apolipoprotein N-acyltransferase